VSVVLVIGFALLTVAVGQALPAGFLNGSGNYLPVLAALIAVGWLIRNNRQRRLALAAAGVFAVSLIFRTIDHAVCTAFPLGTHFLWHVLNALVLYLLLRATMMGGKVGNQDPPYSQAMPS
jgi:hypothetical protein